MTEQSDGMKCAAGHNSLPNPPAATPSAGVKFSNFSPLTSLSKVLVLRFLPTALSCSMNSVASAYPIEAPKVRNWGCPMDLRADSSCLTNPELASSWGTTWVLTYSPSSEEASCGEEASSPGSYVTKSMVMPL